MSELLKSRHAFGNLENINFAIEQGLIDSYDILFVKDANGKPHVGWIDANGYPVVLENKTGVMHVDTLPKIGEANTVYIYNSRLYLWNGTKFVTSTEEIDAYGITTEKIASWDAAESNAINSANKYADRLNIAMDSRVKTVETKSSTNETNIALYGNRLTALEDKVNDDSTIATSARITEINLLAANWVGDETLYSQVVNIEGVTQYSQIDLTPSIEQLVVFYEKDLGFVTENEDGVVTVYAIGQKPENDYTIQVTVTEVTV